MMSIPMNSNSIRVSMVKTGCRGSQFDTKYPIQLNGIISQSEYIESINTINRKFGSGRKVIYIPVIFYSIVAALLMIILVSNRKKDLDNQAIILGTVFSAFFLMIILIMILSYQRITKLKRAVAEESAKYSSRSPIPCTWRVEITQRSTGEYQNNKTATHQIVIDIGRSSTTIHYDNTLYYIRQQQNIDAPPSYYAATKGTCSQCRTVHSDPSTKNCSSCGRAFNKY